MAYFFGWKLFQDITDDETDFVPEKELKWWKRFFIRIWPGSRKEQDRHIIKSLFVQPFSPLTYKNPCIPYMHEVLDVLLEQKQILFRDLELIVIDAVQEQETAEPAEWTGDSLEQKFYQGRQEERMDAWMTHDDGDIDMVLMYLASRLNYLMLVTDRPVYYKEFVHTMYEEYGLIVQRMPKSARLRARGNLILDFERSLDVDAGSMKRRDVLYIPVYKKQWEIRENLDITVPVGYNTLVVTGTGFLPEDKV